MDRGCDQFSLAVCPSDFGVGSELGQGWGVDDPHAFGQRVAVGSLGQRLVQRRDDHGQ